MGTLLVLIILGGVIALIIRSLRQDIKNGKSIQCGGECKHCGGCGKQRRDIL